MRCLLTQHIKTVFLQSCDSSSLILKALLWTSQRGRAGRAVKATALQLYQLAAAYVVADGAQSLYLIALRQPGIGTRFSLTHLTSTAAWNRYNYTWRLFGPTARFPPPRYKQMKYTVMWACKAGVDSPFCLQIVGLSVWRFIAVNTASEDRQSRPVLTGETLLLLLLLLPCSGAGRRLQQQGALLLNSGLSYHVSMDVCPLWPRGAARDELNKKGHQHAGSHDAYLLLQIPHFCLCVIQCITFTFNEVLLHWSIDTFNNNKWSEGCFYVQMDKHYTWTTVLILRNIPAPTSESGSSPDSLLL